MKFVRSYLFVSLMVFISELSAQVPQLIHYQGRVAVGGTNFDGTGQFKFALVNGTGTATFWSNDGASTGGGEPASFVGLTVSKGLYSVLLGDATLPNMTVVPSTVFTNGEVGLRIWFNDGVAGFQLLSPDQRIAAVGYAMMAANVPDGLITASKIADGAITATKLADGAVTGGKLAPGTVTGATLAASLALGATNTNGRLDIYRTPANTPAISLVGSSSQISTYGGDGAEQVRLGGSSYGEMSLNSSGPGHEHAVILSANGINGGSLALNNSTGSTRANLSGANTGGTLSLYNADGTTTLLLEANVGGKGKITTDVLQIKGGADLSEQFDIAAVQETPRPGMVVCIDPQSPGRLLLSTRAYDRAVAGVMSGAGGVTPGMMMGQNGTVADGQYPVALTGRVYCLADARAGAIRPGDLITTSETPGHAMKVTDMTKAQGAILGKAMSSLETGKGLVLILVSLQ